MLELDIAGQLMASQCRYPNVARAVAGRGCRGFVYVMVPEGEQSVCKIGCTEVLSIRLAGLQCGNHLRLGMAAAVAVFDADPLALEQLVHAALDVDGLRRHNEWFDIDEVRAVEAVIAVAKSHSISVSSVGALLVTDAEATRQRRRIERESERAALRTRLGIDE